MLSFMYMYDTYVCIIMFILYGILCIVYYVFHINKFLYKI